LSTRQDAASKNLSSAFDAANKARQNSKNATVAQTDAVRDAMAQLQLESADHRRLRHRERQPGRCVHRRGDRSARGPTPVCASRAVTDITVGIDINTGATVLKWKGNNPGGSSNVSYIVRRKLAGAADFAFIGTAGSSGPDARTYTDSTLPQGVDSVAYLITATRGSSTGPSVQVQVRFGTIGSPGQFGVTSVKMAA